MDRFFKGIIVGLGGVAPGLSGSVLLIIFGMYRETLGALGSLFSNFKKNIRFLLPLVSGMFLGVLLFSRVIDYLLTNHEIPTRFCFLGLILGTLPMVWKEVCKEGFHKKYLPVILFAAACGVGMFTLNTGLFPQVTVPTLPQCILLGVAVAASAIIPGVDPAVLLSTLGLYEVYVSALADLQLTILIPMLLGLAAGAVGISFAMSILFKRFYTASFSVIFGIFLAMIPNMLTEDCVLQSDFRSVISILLLISGFLISWYLGDLPSNQQRIKAFLSKHRQKG